MQGLHTIADNLFEQFLYQNENFDQGYDILSY